MPTSRFTLLPVLVLIACDSPVAPAATNLRIPDFRADAGVVRTKTNGVFDIDASAGAPCQSTRVI